MHVTLATRDCWQSPAPSLFEQISDWGGCFSINPDFPTRQKWLPVFLAAVARPRNPLVSRESTVELKLSV